MKQIIISTALNEIPIHEITRFPNTSIYANIIVKERKMPIRLGIIKAEYSNPHQSNELNKFSLVWNIGDTGGKKFDSVTRLLEWYIPQGDYQFYWLE